ncbi:MAG: glycosyltransferase family 39 protein, partial [Chloroflexota bacterium]|nr:glycosyltransferase family 39 protein [Chloroflexota bacterium]
MTKPQVSNLKSLISNLKLCHRSSVVCLILLLCAVAIVPLLRSESPCTHDGGLHYFRVTAMRHALQDGVIFTRYLPDLAFGYGYPFFNYRAALSYYLALALHLVGLPLPLALNGVYVLSILGSAFAAYLLARDLFGPRAGIVAAAAYAYAPYQFLDALLRGNAPEALALPLFPLILWAFRRLVLTGQRRWFLISVVSLSALHLSHVISFFLFTPFLLAYLTVLWLVYRREGHWVATGSAFAMAWGLTAFFWGPALLERGYAQLHMSHVTRNNDFHYNFLGLAEIFAPPAPVDTSLMNPPMRVHLGLVPAILGGVGLVVGLVRLREREQRTLLIFFALAAAVMLWMSTRASLWLWEHVPLLPFVQFPWRFVGRAALPVALLTSAIFYKPQLATRHSQPAIAHWSLVIVYCSLLILSALPATYPPYGYCPSGPQPTISDVFAYEHRSKLVGVDPEGSYFPAWVKQRPESSPLEEQYSTGGPVARFDETILPRGASVVEADYGPNQARVIVETPDPFRARYLAFYFPGWRVTVDDKPVSIVPTEPEGLISFDVPAGRHTVAIRFGETPLRIVADTISLLSLAALLALVLRPSRITQPKSQIPNTKYLIPNPESRTPTPHWLLLLTSILLLIAKLAIVDRTDTPFRHPTLRPDTSLPNVEHPLGQPYADGLTLIGYDQHHTVLPTDSTQHITLYWTAYAQPTARYQTVAHLVGSDGLRWSLPDTFRPRGYADHPPTTTWAPGRYALDVHEIEPLPGTPPGTYDIVLTVFDRATLAPLSVLDEQGQPAAPDLTLGQITLTAPRQIAPHSEEELGKGLDIRHRLDVPLGPLTLLGADFDRDQAAPGDPVLLTTFWHADQQPAQDLT